MTSNHGIKWSLWITWDMFTHIQHRFGIVLGGFGGRSHRFTSLKDAVFVYIKTRRMYTLIWICEHVLHYWPTWLIFLHRFVQLWSLKSRLLCVDVSFRYILYACLHINHYKIFSNNNIFISTWKSKLLTFSISWGNLRRKSQSFHRYLFNHGKHHNFGRCAISVPTWRILLWLVSG